MDGTERARLEAALERIMEKAENFGLDFFDMRFEICPADVIYTFGAYGMPTRFSHWSFGKAFHRMKTEYDYNLSRIYELVINSDPCYAFLLEGNTLLQNQLVAAHVLAHADFFKNNWRFAGTSRFMVETMAANAERIRRYEFRYGRAAVEEFLDAALAVAEQVDPYHREPRRPRQAGRDGGAGAGGWEDEEDGEAGRPPARPSTPYDDLWALDERLQPGAAGPASAAPAGKAAAGRPQAGERDLVLYILEHSRHLKDWQRDVLGIVRQEMLYFYPQIETKIMNEGWASYWHARILRELDLPEEDTVEFARMHAGVTQPSRMRLNPYHVGMKIFEAIEKRWDDPSPEDRERLGLRGQEGRAKIFEVRQTETDVSFIRNYLTEELVEELDLYLYAKVDDRWQVVEKDWEAVRDGLVSRLANGGIPVIAVADGDFRGNGELLLEHRYEGQELDLRHTEKTLPYVYRLWGRPVHLDTVVDGKPVRFSFDGSELKRTG